MGGDAFRNAGIGNLGLFDRKSCRGRSVRFSNIE